jgi:hypothetical protein
VIHTQNKIGVPVVVVDGALVAVPPEEVLVLVLEEEEYAADVIPFSDGPGQTEYCQRAQDNVHLYGVHLCTGYLQFSTLCRMYACMYLRTCVQRFRVHACVWHCIRTWLCTSMQVAYNMSYIYIYIYIHTRQRAQCAGCAVYAFYALAGLFS